MEKKNEIIKAIKVAKAYSTYDNYDPNGSYSGQPKDKKEEPTQDADDL